MVSTVSTRPNHYETLGLAPTATADEIARAFERELYRPRAFGGLAQLGVAYETLRDPAKRREYDRSLGLAPDPQPRQWTTPRWTATTFTGLTPTLPSAPQSPASARSAEPTPEPRTAPFIAASLRDPAEPELRHAPPPEPLQMIDRAPDPFLLPEAENGALPWKRAGIAGGALVLAVGLLGAWAGWEASNDMAAQQPEQAMTLALPPAKPLPAMTSRSPAPAPSVAEVRPPARQTVADASPVPAQRTLPRPLELTAAEEQQLAGNPFVESATAQIETAAAETAEEATPVAAAPAAMPLPDRVIARTIQRIGYACGQVASTTAIEGGAPGVFKVTCTSGHSYRAQPIRGRYHFRRLAGQ